MNILFFVEKKEKIPIKTSTEKKKNYIKQM